MKALPYVLLSLLLPAANGVVQAQIPTDNPYATRYGLRDHWTDGFKWGKVTNALAVGGLMDKAGAVDSLKLRRTLDSVAAAGGGVLYFPAGTYYFAWHLHLAPGVVIRGETPGPGSAGEPTRSSTRFEFPAYEPSLAGAGTPNHTAFKSITADSRGQQNFGLVNLDINRARIDFYTDWPGRYHDRIIVYGVRQNNAAAPDPEVPSSVQRDEGHGWQRWPAYYKENIVACVENYCLIADCRLNDAVTDDFTMPRYLTNDGYVFDKDEISFRYAFHRGITLYRKGTNANAEARVSGNYVKTSEYFHKINGVGHNIQVRNNDTVNTDREPEYKLVSTTTNPGQLALALQSKADSFFDTDVQTTADGGTLRYRLMKPRTYDPGKKYPLVLFYHGGGEVGDTMRHTEHFVQVFTTQRALDAFPCFVALPLLHDKKESWLTDDLARQAPSQPMQRSIELVNTLVKRYPIDRKRIYATGISYGGNAALEATIRYPRLFARTVAMSAVCRLTPGVAKRLRNEKIMLTAGEADTHISLNYLRMVVAGLRKARVDVEYKEFPNTGHFSWVPLYGDASFLPWLFGK